MYENVSAQKNSVGRKKIILLVRHSSFLNDLFVSFPSKETTHSGLFHVFSVSKKEKYGS